MSIGHLLADLLLFISVTCVCECNTLKVESNLILFKIYLRISRKSYGVSVTKTDYFMLLKER